LLAALFSFNQSPAAITKWPRDILSGVVTCFCKTHHRIFSVMITKGLEGGTPNHVADLFTVAAAAQQKATRMFSSHAFHMKSVCMNLGNWGSGATLA